MLRRKISFLESVAPQNHIAQLPFGPYIRGPKS